MNKITLSIFIFGVIIAYYVFRKIMREGKRDYNFSNVLVVLLTSILWPLALLLLMTAYIIEESENWKPPKWM